MYTGTHNVAKVLRVSRRERAKKIYKPTIQFFRNQTAHFSFQNLRLVRFRFEKTENLDLHRIPHTSTEQYFFTSVASDLDWVRVNAIRV